MPVRLFGSGMIKIAMPGGAVVRVGREVELEVLDRGLAAPR